MTTEEEVVLPKQVRPGGTGIWAPVPEPREPQEWVVQADDDPSIVLSVD